MQAASNCQSQTCVPCHQNIYCLLMPLRDEEVGRPGAVKNKRRGLPSRNTQHSNHLSCLCVEGRATSPSWCLCTSLTEPAFKHCVRFSEQQRFAVMGHRVACVIKILLCFMRLCLLFEFWLKGKPCQRYQTAVWGGGGGGGSVCVGQRETTERCRKRREECFFFFTRKRAFCMHAMEPIRCVYLSVLCLTGVFTPVLLWCKCQSAIWGISSSAGSLWYHRLITLQRLFHFLITLQRLLISW